MKRNLIMSLTLCVALILTMSFSLIKHPAPAKKAHTKAAPVKKVLTNCTADMGTVNLVSVSPTSFTVTWTYTGTPTSFNYGGYYYGGPFVVFPTGNTYSNTITLPRPASN